MVALPNQPALTDRETLLLASFITLKFDLAALVEKEKLSPQDLLAFIQSPAVKANLADLRSFTEDAFALRSLHSRAAAIDALESVIKTAENPIEKRRAASAMLRGLAPCRPLRDRAGAAPGSTRTTSTSAADPNNPSDQADRRAPSTNTAPAAPAPARPRVKPSPNFSAHEAAETIAAALATPTPENHATIQAFTAATATLGQAPAPADPESFAEVIRTIAPCENQSQRHLIPRPATETSAPFLCTLRKNSYEPCSDLDYDLLFTRSPASPWLLTSLKRRIPKGSG